HARHTHTDHLSLHDALPISTRCILTGQCGLTRVMQGALDKFMAHLDAFTLADIMPARDDQTRSQRMVTGCERSSEITVSPTSPSISEMTRLNSSHVKISYAV